MGGEAYSYADDYQIVGRLKQFADRKGMVEIPGEPHFILYQVYPLVGLVTAYHVQRGGAVGALLFLDGRLRSR